MTAIAQRTVLCARAAAPGRTVVVALADHDLAMGLSRLRRAVHRALLDGAPHVAVDVSGLRGLTSGTVAALLWANRHCAQRGGEVVLRAPGEANLDLLRRTGLGDVLRVEHADDRDDEEGTS